MRTAITPAVAIHSGGRDFRGAWVDTAALTAEAEAADAAGEDGDEAATRVAEEPEGDWCGAEASCAMGIEPELIAAARPVSVSRLRRCRSVRMSAACWARRLRSFSSAFEMMSSSLGGRSGFRRMGGVGARSRIA